jgi:PAS domain S-box-containing protein
VHVQADWKRANRFGVRGLSVYTRLLVLSLAWAVICLDNSPALPAAEKTVIVVDSFSDHTSVDIDFLKSELRARIPWPINFDIEFPETRRFDDDSYEKLVWESLQHRYIGRNPDLLLARGYPALQFLLKHREDLFTDVPIVFWDVDVNKVKGQKMPPGVTGVTAFVDIKGTIDLALRLHPDATTVAVIANDSAFERYWLAASHDELLRHEDKVRELDFVALPTSVLLERVNALPRGTVVLFQLFPEDSLQPAIGDHDILAWVGEHRPTYCIWPEICLDHGGIGGVGRGEKKQAVVAAELARRVLSGERPEAIPIVHGSDREVEVDWRALRRWGIDETKLPPGSIVLNRQPSFWELYKLYVLGAVSLIVAEALLILALFWQRARRRRVEEALRISDTRLREAQAIAHCGSWEWNIATDEIHWSDEMYRILGLKPQSVAPDQSLLQVHNLPDRTAKLEEALRTHQLYCQEHSIIWPDGEERIVIELGQPKYDSRGKPISVVGTLLDITERRQAEQRLRESEKRFRTMADGAPVMMWISGVDKRCTDFNRGWLEFTVHSDDLERCLATYTEAFDARRPFTMEYQLRRYDGQYRWITNTGTPRFLPDSTFAGYIGCCMDINDQKVAELARRELAARLMNAQEAGRTRIARELHDSIGQSIALLTLQMPVSGESPSGHLGTKHLSLQDVKDKLKDLGTQVSRLSHQIHSSELEYLGLPRAIAGLCTEFSQQYSIDVKCSCLDVHRKLDSATALAFFRVTQEALHNIARHSHAKTASVNLKVENSYLMLAIRDDGVGFNADKNGDQPGLGLVSMRERIHLLGGDFAINSSTGAGTAIVAKVPLPTTA